MDWIATLNRVKEKLQMNGYDQTVNRIIDAQMVLGTPGEMYIEVMNELMDVRKRLPQEYKIIEQEVEQLLDYGKSLNYYNPSV